MAGNGSGNWINVAPASLALLAILSGCSPPPDEQHFTPQSSAERGREIIERVGCAACHTIPGVGWPKGRIGPPLDGFAGQALIAGRVPNRADVLVAFVRDAPSVVPGTGMPSMPLSEEESRDVAAYLYTLQP